MAFEITGAKILSTQNTFFEGSLFIEHGKIVSIGSGSGCSATVDASGLYALPGIIDFHGDAFEKAILPRPDALIPYHLALAEVDRQVVGSGITTPFISFSYTWEKEDTLRNDEGALTFMAEYKKMLPYFSCDPKLHLRFEIYHLEGLNKVKEWLSNCEIQAISFNDHISYLESLLADEGKAEKLASRKNMSPAELKKLYDSHKKNKGIIMEEVLNLAGLARANNIVMASHDEEDLETRMWYHEAGCKICEFPCNEDTAIYAVSIGDAVVLGAPNAIKGGSIYNRVSAQEAVKKGICTILASDYYYSSMLQAVFLLDSLGILPLSLAWDLVSKNVARATGLFDRGSLSPGLRADIVLVDYTGCMPEVVATFVAGNLVWAGKKLFERKNTFNPVQAPSFVN